MNKTLKTISAVLAFSAVSFAQAKQCEVITDVNFDRFNKDRNYYMSDAVKDFKSVDHVSLKEPRGLNERGSNKWKRQHEVQDGALVVKIPKGKSSGRDTGFVFDHSFQAALSATMTYKVKFDNGFDWTKGGKLLGFGGNDKRGNRLSGISTGCKYTKDSFSSRVMWREDGELVTYTYYPDGTTRCGKDAKAKGFRFETGKWYTITKYVKMNDIGKKNGQIKLQVDDKTVVDIKNAVLRKKNLTKINAALFHVYAGGGRTNENFFAKRNISLRLDDIKVYRNCDMSK